MGRTGLGRGHHPSYSRMQRADWQEGGRGHQPTSCGLHREERGRVARERGEGHCPRHMRLSRDEGGGEAHFVLEGSPLSTLSWKG